MAGTFSKKNAGGKASGGTAFHEYYSVLFGPRWTALEAALRSPAALVAFSPEARPESAARAAESEAAILGGSEDHGDGRCYYLDAAREAALLHVEARPESAARAAESEAAMLGGSEDHGDGRCYYLDAASVFAARCLEMRPEDERVLDACAAPGGKSLVLASMLPPGARLIANELSAQRRRRLRAVLDSHLPPKLRSRVELWGRDAAKLCKADGGSRIGSFSAILLDAPCSSERHVIVDEKALAQWTFARIRNLASRQWALLSSAFLMLRPGGRLLYSTCALSPNENEDLVERLSLKYGDEVEYLPVFPPGLAFPGAEERRRGFIILPDRAGGAGPMYVCRIGKRQSGPRRA